MSILRWRCTAFKEACRNVIEDVYKCVVIWHVLLIDLKGLQRLKTRFEPVISATSHLTDEYHEALAKFGVVEKMAEDYARMNLRMSAATSQPLQQYYSRIRGPNPFVYTIDNSSRIPPILNLIDDVLNDDRSQLLGVPRIMDEIEYLIRDEVSQRALITPSMAKKLSEVAAFGEINQQINQHQPKIQTFKYESTCAKQFEECADITNRFHKILQDTYLSKYSTSITQFDFPRARNGRSRLLKRCALKKKSSTNFGNA